MKQALHIFRKDVTHLWPQIAIVLLLVAAFAWASLQNDPRSFAAGQLGFLKDLLGVLVPAAYAWLIVTLVHQEALPGDRQFWLTRPYRTRSLVAAKAIFVVLFVSLTMVAKDCFIAAAEGLPIASDFVGLLLRQLAWTAWVVLPALAAGAVTRNLQETGMVGAGVALVYALAGTLLRKSFWPGVEWVRDYLGMILLLTICGAIVLWQYGRRETATARAAVAGCSILVMFGLPLLPWNLAFGVQMLARRPGIDWSRAQLTPDFSRVPSGIPVPGNATSPVAIGLPLRLTGMPPGTTIVSDGTRVSIRSGPREVWNSGWQPGWYESKSESYRAQVVYIDNRVYRSFEDQPVTVRVSLGLTILQDAPPLRVPASQRTFQVEGSRCEERSTQTYPPAIWCLAALRAQPRALVGVEASGIAQTLSQMGTRSYAPYEAVLDLSPLVITPLSMVPLPDSAPDLRAIWERPDAQIVLTLQHPVAHFRRELEFPGVRLAQYALPPARMELRAVP